MLGQDKEKADDDQARLKRNLELLKTKVSTPQDLNNPRSAALASAAAVMADEATVGGLARLLLYGQEASLYACVGRFLLIGIVKKNGIMMLDFALERMADGMDRVAAVHKACVE